MKENYIQNKAKQFFLNVLVRNTWIQTFDQAEKYYSGVFEGPESIAHISFYVQTLIVRVIRVGTSKRSDWAEKLYLGVFRDAESNAHIRFYVWTLIFRVIRVRTSKRSGKLKIRYL
jgi:hypothetical protein